MAYFSEQTIDAVWQKAKVVAGYDPSQWRKDFAGAWIARKAYGLQGSYGWEIDHMKPVTLRGTDDLSNLYPLHWQNNRTKGDNYPFFKTSVSSSANANIDRIQSWKVR